MTGLSPREVRAVRSLGLRQRQGEAKKGTAFRMIFCPNLPVVRLNDRTRHGQTKPSALLFGRVEGLEDLADLVLRDACTRIAYRYFDRSTLPRAPFGP